MTWTYLFELLIAGFIVGLVFYVLTPSFPLEALR